MDDAAYLATLRAARRRIALLGAAAVAPFVVIDALLPGFAVALPARAVWVAALLWGGHALRPRGTTTLVRVDAVLSITTLVAAVVLVVATGGAASGYFAFLVALPFCIALLVPGAVRCAVIAGLVSAATGTALLVDAGTPTLEVARWLATTLATGALATYGTILFHAELEQRLRAERARADLAEALADHERRLAQAEKLAAIGQLAAGVAHEVNNPLAFLKANLGWVRERLAERGVLGTDAEIDEVIAEANQGVTRIARIVSDLSVVSHGSCDAPCRAPVGASIAEACRVAAARTAAARLRVSVADGLPDARICRGRLVQVLVNLVANAADAIAGAPPERAWIEVTATRAAAGVALAVEDGGRGFAPEVLPRALEPFVTTKAPGMGMGLGLALAREYVVRAGGTIAVGNGAAGGARVGLELPAATALDEPRCRVCEYQPELVAPALARSAG